MEPDKLEGQFVLRIGFNGQTGYKKFGERKFHVANLCPTFYHLVFSLNLIFLLASVQEAGSVIPWPGCLKIEDRWLVTAGENNRYHPVIYNLGIWYGNLSRRIYLYVYMCIYIYMHVYIYACMCINVYIYIYIMYIYMYIYICVYICVCMWMCVCLYVCICLYVCMYVCIYLSIYLSMYLCIYVSMYLCM